MLRMRRSMTLATATVVSSRASARTGHHRPGSAWRHSGCGQSLLRTLQGIFCHTFPGPAKIQKFSDPRIDDAIARQLEAVLSST